MSDNAEKGFKAKHRRFPLPTLATFMRDLQPLTKRGKAPLAIPADISLLLGPLNFTTQSEAAPFATPPSATRCSSCAASRLAASFTSVAGWESMIGLTSS